MSKISIITPSYNMLDYLKLCAASIRDQSGASFEHIVVDGLSTDGTAQWLGEREDITSIIEKDSGMYDAVNKGLRAAKGDILTYLNCDEQYLPGTLVFVKEYFEQHPEVDMIFGNLLLTRPDGSLAAWRKSFQPRWPYILASHLYVATCTMFFRRRIIEEDFFFDLNFRANADEDFVVRVLRGGFKVKHLNKYFSAFTLTGKNLSNDPVAEKEAKIMLERAPGFIRKGRPVINIIRLAEKFLSGAYFQEKPLDYSIYVMNKGEERLIFSDTTASYKWQWN